MKQRVRGRLSYANVMATLALFVALGGAAYAIDFPKNSVTSKNVVNNSLIPADIAHLQSLKVDNPVLVPKSEQKTLASNGPLSVVAKCNQLMVGSPAVQALLVIHTDKAHSAAGTSSPFQSNDMNAGDDLAIADTGGAGAGGPVFDWGTFAANSPEGKGLQGIGSAAINVEGANKCSFTLASFG
jgi:hypothetical protein